MMNEKTINEQYAYIRTLLEDQRLKEALMQLESLLWQCPDWNLRTQLEQLQTSYKYMLDYMRQGVNDPERWNVYRKLLADTWSIADQSRLLMLDNASSRYYHEVRRTPRTDGLAAYDLKKLLHILESFNDDLAVSGLLSEAKTLEVMKRHEDTLKSLFLTPAFSKRVYYIFDFPAGAVHSLNIIGYYNLINQAFHTELVNCFLRQLGS